MADINLFGTTRNATVSASVHKCITPDNVVFKVEVGKDMATFFISTSDLETIFGTINNYLESKVVNA